MRNGRSLLRILHIAYIYPPELTVADGITNVVYNVTKELAKRGHRVTVYASDMLDLHGKASVHASNRVINGVDVHYARSLLKYKTFIITPSLFPLLSKRIAEFDVIHVHDCRSFQGISAYLFAKAKNVPYVFQPHGSYLPSLPESNAKTIAKFTLDKLISGRILYNASKLIAVSREEAEQYRMMGVPEEKIEVVPNGIDLPEYDNLPPRGAFKKRFGLDEKEKIVLYLGRIHKIKGVDILISAFANIAEMDYVRLVIVGPDDGYLGELQALIKALKVEDRVLILGPLYGKDKLEAYVDADVYVLPSRYETFPVSLLEAVACGTPVILTENCGIAEYFKDKAGLVVKTDSLSLQEALVKMLMYRKRQKIFRENCKATIEKFNISDSVSMLEKVYEKIVR